MFVLNGATLALTHLIPVSQTMESISKKLGLLLEGKPYEEMFEFCDFGLNEQNEASQAKGIQASAKEKTACLRCIRCHVN